MAIGDLRFGGLIDDCYTQIGSHVYMTVQATVLLKGVGTRSSQVKTFIEIPVLRNRSAV